MSEKVKLPRKVAEALERTKSKHYTWNNHDLCYIVLNPSGFSQYKQDADIYLLNKWSHTNELKFAITLLNGYEVEQTPEEKVREYYELNKPDEYMNQNQFNIQAAVREGVLNTLNLLNIKIKGVNDQ
ncbi:hypothetical protein JCM16163A_41470 [Paenibacillus sp. YK5]